MGVMFANLAIFGAPQCIEDTQHHDVQDNSKRQRLEFPGGMPPCFRNGILAWIRGPVFQILIVFLEQIFSIYGGNDRRSTSLMI